MRRAKHPAPTPAERGAPARPGSVDVLAARPVATAPPPAIRRPRRLGKWRRDARAPQQGLPRKEVIQPHLPVRLPCYDFTPIMNDTLGGCPLAVSEPTSSTTHFRDVTGGVYKSRERIHRGVLIRDY